MNPKILENEVVLFQLLLEMDVLPFNRTTAKLLKNPYYWHRKLENLGYIPQNSRVDAQKLYKYIHMYTDIHIAALKACEANEPDIVKELAAWAPTFDVYKCAELAKRSTVLISLADMFNTPESVIKLLNTQTVPIQSRIDVLNYLNPDILEKCLDRLDNSEIFEAIDACNKIPINFKYFSMFDVPKALRNFLEKSYTPPETIDAWIRIAIQKHRNKNLQVLSSVCSEDRISEYLKLGVQCQNLDAVKLLYSPEYGTKALTESILRNNIILVEYLKESVTPKHRKMAKAQHRVEIYNLLLK